MHINTFSATMHHLSPPIYSALCVPLQVKLSRLCEQDKILKDLEARISSLKEDKVHTLPNEMTTELTALITAFKE